MEQSHGVLLVAAPHDTQFGTQVETMLMHFLREFRRHGLFIFDVIVRLFFWGASKSSRLYSVLRLCHYSRHFVNLF